MSAMKILIEEYFIHFIKCLQLLKGQTTILVPESVIRCHIGP
jgi:hypothetical protein